MTYDDVLPYFVTDVLGAPEPTMLQHVQLAAEEFFRRTLLWQQPLDPIRIREGARTYEVELDNGVVLNKLLVAFADDRQLALCERTTAKRLLANNDACWFAYTDSPTAIGTSDLGGSQILKVEASLKPSITATSIPDEYAEYASDIALGAAARTLMVPRQVWTNPQLAAIKAQEFNARLGVIALQQAKGFSRARLRSRGFFI